MEVDKLDDIELYQQALLIEKIGNQAVQKAIARNKKNNIASVFSRDGIIYYLLPSGEITRKSPFL